jgi:hypothetical protein
MGAVGQRGGQDQGRREKLVSGGGGLARIFGDLFFSNFSHFSTSHRRPPQKPAKRHPPPHHEPSIPLSTPLAWAPITPGVGPHPTFRGGASAPHSPPVYAPGQDQ